MSSSETTRDEFFDSLLGDFLDESGQLLDRLNEDLLQLDEWVRSLDAEHTQRCDDELMNNMFRSAHSLKGLSGMLGLDDINSLTHKVENVFDAARKDELTFHADCVEIMFQSIDRLVAMVDTLKDETPDEVDCSSVLKGIHELLQSAGCERGQSTQEDAERALQDAIDAAANTPETTDAAVDTPTPEPQDESPTTIPQEQPARVRVDLFHEIADENEISDKYLAIFIDETDLSLDNLTETLLAVEGGGNAEELQNLLVTSHRIKGSAASVGLNRAAKLAHFMEDLLQELVENGGSLSPQLTDAMLSCTDGLRSYVESLKNGGNESTGFNGLANDLLDARQGHSAPTTDSTDVADVAEPETPDTVDTSADTSPEVSAVEITTVPSQIRDKVTKSAPFGTTFVIGQAGFEADLPLVGLKARLVYEKLAHLGEVFFFSPTVEHLDEIEVLDQVTFGVATDSPVETVRQRLRIAGVNQIAAEQSSATAQADPAPAPVPTPQPKKAAEAAKPAKSTATEPNAKKAAPAAKQRANDTAKKPAETLRVDIDRLDQLMNLAGQLVINKARFTQIGESLKGSVSNKHAAQTLNSLSNTLAKMAQSETGRKSDEDAQTELNGLRSMARRLQNDLESVHRELQSMTHVRNSVNDLAEAIHQLDRVSDGIQQSVMDTRMVPVGPLFTRFRRVVRDITRGNGKNINLVINGEKTELDKRMIDELGDPLIHMVRNSADHGIESPDDRVAAGKPPEGTVTLDAFHRGNSIMIQVTDDGKGLSTDQILQKALDKGIVSPLDAEKMTPHQIYQLIWEPGLSTAEKVTEVSGRGMGMDIVKSKIDDLSGTVELDSTPGKGTVITIKLPLTMAILPSLMVQIDGDTFAMPMESVLEIVRLDKSSLSTVHGKQTACVRDRITSLVDLSEILTWNGTPSTHEALDEDETTVVLLSAGGQEIGLSVDSVLGEEDVVIKSMAENYQNVLGIAGACILGDGHISLILDVATLIDMTSAHATADVA